MGCGRIQQSAGRGVNAGGEGRRAELLHAAKTEELGAWEKLDVFQPRRACSVSKQPGQTSRVLTWNMADGRKSVKVRLAARGYQFPDLREGIVDASGCFSCRSSPLQVISLCVMKKGFLWSLDIKNAFL